MQDELNRAVRVLAKKSHSTRGHCVFIGSANDLDGPVFIGWVPRNGTSITDLLALLQMGSSEEISVLGFCAATRVEVQEDCGKMNSWRIRGHWFARSGPVREYLLKLRGEWIGAGEVSELPPERPRSLCKSSTKARAKPRVNKAASVSTSRRASKRRASK